MKILGNFDQAITEVLQKNVRSRLQFKVNNAPRMRRCLHSRAARLAALLTFFHRGALIRTDYATKYGPSLSRM